MVTMPRNITFDAEGIKERIRQTRVGRDMSYGELARITGMPRSTFMRLEKNLSEGVAYVTLLAVAQALDVDFNWLCGYDPDKYAREDSEEE